MPPDKSVNMTRRALLTEAERDHIRGAKENQQRTWEAISRVKSRINDQMREDIEILSEHRPDLLEELREVVCETGTRHVYGVTLNVDEEFSILGPTPFAPQGETISIAGFRPGIGDEGGGVLFEKQDIEKGEDWVPVGYAPIEEFAEAVKDGRIERGDV